MPDGFFPDSQNLQVREFVKLFEDTYVETPGVIEATAYDTAMMLFQTLSQPEIKSRNELKDHLLLIRNSDCVTGLTSFKDSGDVDKKLYLFRSELSLL